MQGVAVNGRLRGYLHTRSGHDYAVELRAGGGLRCDKRLRELLHADPPALAGLRKRLRQCGDDLDAAAVELGEVVDMMRAPRAAADGPALPSGAFYARVLDELEALGWARVAEVFDGVRSLSLSFSDSAHRQHQVLVRLPHDYPATPPACSAALPRPVDLVWRTGRDGQPPSTLADVVDQYRQAADSYQSLFAALDELHENTWVVEPERPTCADTYRRIIVAKHCTLHIELLGRDGNIIPEFRFNGSENLVRPLRERLADGLTTWDSGASPFANLTRILGTELPRPGPISQSQQQQDDFGVECGLCYAYRLDQAIPDHVCDNSRCAKPFHHVCLFAQLQALPGQRSFDKIFGRCAYCETPISCKVIDA